MILKVAFLVAFFVCDVNSHGRLLEPPNRSSMWRVKETDPAIKPYQSIVTANYDDNQLFCGGYQHQKNLDGKCGICGDPWDGVRENEAGGPYAKGIIVRNYAPGSVMDITIELTAHHMGFFEFRLCEWNNPEVPATHECLNQNLLKFVGTGETQYFAKPDGGSPWVYHIQVQLPPSLTCTQCILQWRYHAGNTYECDSDGNCCVGCGPQEEFYGCADVAIGDVATLPPPNWNEVATTPTAEPSKPSATTLSPTTTPTKTTTTTTPVAPPVDGEPTCQHGVPGKYKYDCTTYYTCTVNYGGPYVYSCPPGTVYDEYRQICDYESNVPPECGTKTTA